MRTSAYGIISADAERGRRGELKAKHFSSIKNRLAQGNVLADAGRGWRGEFKERHEKAPDI